MQADPEAVEQSFVEAGLRKAVQADAETLVALYRNTVRRVNAADYTLEQLRAWAPDHIPVSGFERRIAQTEVFVTEDGSGITGIGSLTGGDYLDLLFVRHDRQRRGLGRLLIAAIEHSARSAGGVSALTSDVSITAKPLFIASGFNIITEQMVELRGQTLKNFKMQKNLA